MEKAPVVFVLFIFVQYLSHISGLQRNCPCVDVRDCDKPQSKPKGSSQVIIYLEEDAEWDELPWQHIDVIVTQGDCHSDQLMCLVHSAGSLYGILVTSLDFSAMDDVDGWLSSYSTRLANQQRDVVHFDLDLIFHEAGVKDIEARIKFLEDISSSLRELIPHVAIGVVYHKREECTNKNTICHYLQRLMQIADYSILHVENRPFLPVINGRCIAKSISPYITYLAGLEEFSVCNVGLDRAMIQISLEATEFTCQHIDPQNGLCNLESCSHTTSTSLSKVSELQKLYAIQGHWNDTYKSPYMDYTNTSNGRRHQIWYENLDSLSLKLNLTKFFNLKGVVLRHIDISTNSDLVSDLLLANYHNNSHVGNPSAAAVNFITADVIGICAAFFLFGALLGAALVYTTVYLHRTGSKHATWVRAPSSEDLTIIGSRDCDS